MFGLDMFRSEKRTGFERVSGSDDDQEELLSQSERSSLEAQSRRPIPQVPSWIAASIAVVCTAILFAVLGVLAIHYVRRDADAFSIRHTSQYCVSPEITCEPNANTSTAPIVGDVGIQYSPVRFEGSLMKPNDFKLDAGPEVDAAWKSLGADYHAARIPVEEAARSNLAPDQVKIKKKYGGGYPAHVEGLHHLHCLVRRILAYLTHR